MDNIVVILGIIFLLVGLAGCIVPIIPGPPIGYLSLLALLFHATVDISTSTLVWFGIAVAFVTIIDYFLPIWGTKKFGGTNAGKRGSTIGLFGGLVFPIFGPLTILIGPFLGAIIGEMVSGQDQKTALRSGIGSFLGFVGGVLLKAGVVLAMGYHFTKLLI